MVSQYGLLTLALVICSSLSTRSRVVPPKAIRKINKHKQDEGFHDKLLRTVLQLADSGDLPHRRSGGGSIADYASPEGSIADRSEATTVSDEQVPEWTSSHGLCRGSNGKYGGYCHNKQHGSNAQDCVAQAASWTKAVEYTANSCSLLQLQRGAPVSCPAGFSGPHTGTGSADDYTGNGKHGVTCYVPTEATAASALEVDAADTNDDPLEGRSCNDINADLQEILPGSLDTAEELETQLKAECDESRCAFIVEQDGLAHCMKEKQSRVASLREEARLLKMDPAMESNEGQPI